MKKITLLFAIIFLVTTTTQAKIWRVNNDATKGANFTTLQLCNDNVAVLNGDTVHLEPSSNAYAAANISKALIIIGNGYFLAGAGANVGLQQNTTTSTISGFLTFQSATNGTGAPNTGAGAGNCTIAGINITQSLRFLNVSNITITRCNIQSIEFTNYGNTAASAIKITKNFIKNSVGVSGFTGTPSVNVTFENNIFSIESGQGGNNIQFDLPPTVKGLFRNNTINEFANAIALSNFYVTNNISMNVAAAGAFSSTNVNNVYKNNIVIGNNFGNGITNGTAGNITGANIALIFTANPNTGNGDARFQLIANASNPAFAGGETIGTVTTPSCGAFGATDPYKLSGIPAVPTIYSLTLPSGVATGATSMLISVSTRSNN